MKLSKLIRELSVARDKIKSDPEVGIYSQGTDIRLKFEGIIKSVYGVCKIDKEDTIFLMLELNE